MVEQETYVEWDRRQREKQETDIYRVSQETNGGGGDIEWDRRQSEK